MELQQVSVLVEVRLNDKIATRFPSWSIIESFDLTCLQVVPAQVI
jgi:hypothetical protein